MYSKIICDCSVMCVCGVKSVYRNVLSYVAFNLNTQRVYMRRAIYFPIWNLHNRETPIPSPCSVVKGCMEKNICVAPATDMKD